VRDGELAKVGLQDEGLCPRELAPAGGGVPGVADGGGAGERLNVVLVKHLRHEAHALVDVDADAVQRRDAGTLLAACDGGVGGGGQGRRDDESGESPRGAGVRG
jgi:hypothetical protein